MLVLDPDYNAAHLRLARLLFLERKWDEAASHAREALRTNPDQPPARASPHRDAASTSSTNTTTASPWPILLAKFCGR